MFKASSFSKLELIRTNIKYKILKYEFQFLKTFLQRIERYGICRICPQSISKLTIGKSRKGIVWTRKNKRSGRGFRLKSPQDIPLSTDNPSTGEESREDSVSSYEDFAVWFSAPSIFPTACRRKGVGNRRGKSGNPSFSWLWRKWRIA